MNDDFLQQAFSIKKEKFRIEIRKKHMQLEFMQRRMKLSEPDYYITKQQQQQLQQQQQQLSQTHDSQFSKPSSEQQSQQTTNSTTQIVRQVQQNIKLSFFCGEERMYEQELRQVVIAMRQYIERLEFHEMEDVLKELKWFLKGDGEDLPIKIPKIISSGMLEQFSELLSTKFDQMNSIANLVLLIICNLTLGSPMQNISIFDAALKNHLLKFLDYNLIPDIIDSALHIITHYIYDQTPPKNEMLRQGLIQRFINIYAVNRFGAYTRYTKKYYVTYTWCLSAIGKETKSLNRDEIHELNKIARQLFLVIEDEASATNLLWWFLRTTSEQPTQARAFLESDPEFVMTSKLITYLGFQDTQIRVALVSYKVLANLIEAGNEREIKEFIDRGLLNGLMSIIEECSTQPKTVGMVLWSISNMVLLGSEVIERILAHPIFDIILFVANKYEDHRGIEAITCLCNLQLKSSLSQIHSYIERGVYRILINSLQESNQENILIKVMDALATALDHANETSEKEKYNLLSYLDANNLSRNIDSLQNYPSQVFFERAVDFVETYFSPSSIACSDTFEQDQSNRQMNPEHLIPDVGIVQHAFIMK